MGDLAEIRRFWPWVRAKDQSLSRGFYPRNRRGIYLGIGYSEALWKFPAGWNVWVTDDRPWPAYKVNPWSGSDIEAEAGVRHPTIAAAMAAAGFAERKWGEFAERRHRWLATRFGALRLWGFAPTLSGYEPVKLESRQRPRKKVRLGKRGRRLALAASLGEALDATRHWRAK